MSDLYKSSPSPAIDDDLPFIPSSSSSSSHTLAASTTASSHHTQHTSPEVAQLLHRMNGGAYTGKKHDLLPHGSEGEYVFPSGVIYRGSFLEGMFHGSGTLTFPDGSTYVATFNLGHLTDGTYFFEDQLEYAPNKEKDAAVKSQLSQLINKAAYIPLHSISDATIASHLPSSLGIGWLYCTDADRRYWVEHQQGLKFMDKNRITPHDLTYTQHSNIAAEQKTQPAQPGTLQQKYPLPYGCYDLGDCFLDPKDERLYNYDSTFYRLPTREEVFWAKRKCRIGLDSSIAPPSASTSLKYPQNSSDDQISV